MPRSVRFTWFKYLISKGLGSTLTAYLAWKMLKETKATIKVNKSVIYVKPPEVVIINSHNPAFNDIKNLKHDIRNSLSKYDDPLEWEFRYIPDYLGFYLKNPVRLSSTVLSPGIYLLIDRIIDYTSFLSSRTRLNLDPNVILSVVFYHEYMHMLFDLTNLGMKFGGRQLSELSINDIEEAACEGLAFMVLPDDLKELVSEMLVPYLIESKIEGTSHINLSNFSIEVKYVRQLIDREQFLSMPRTYPYSLVRNFFVNKAELGWKLLSDLLILSGAGIEQSKILKREVTPKVFIVIKDSAQEVCEAYIGEFRYKYNYDYDKPIIY